MIERVGGVVLTNEYWDCECDENYIHPANEKHCAKCGADESTSPSSHANEVLAAGLSIQQW